MNTAEWIERLHTLPRKPNENSATMIRRLYPYEFVMPSDNDRNEARMWLHENCHNDDFVQIVNYFHLKDELTAMQFKLTFSERLA